MREQRYRKVKKAPDRPGWEEGVVPEKKTAPAEQVPDPKYPERLLHPAELRDLTSVRAKIAGGRRGEYTGAEAIAAWRVLFWRTFDMEDPDLATPSARTRAAQLYTRRVSGWAEGSSPKLFSYLRAMVKLWRDKKEGDTFPGGEAPRLTNLLKQDKKGPSGFWRNWIVKRRKRSDG